MDSLKSYVERIEKAMSGDCIMYTVRLDELSFVVKREAIRRVLTSLRDDEMLLFKELIDICGVDYPDRIERFDVVYNLLSLKFNRRLRIVITTDEETPVPSVTGVFSVANWLERETYDMFGIQFDGHPDLRRLLTDYGFDGFPLRKDFPLTGFVEVRYDSEHRRVSYSKLKLPQAYRDFDFISPWEGMTIELPGDEKATK